MIASELLIAFLAQLGVISLALTICSIARDRVSGNLTLVSRIAGGLLFGSTAAILMQMPGELINGFRFDLRIVPLAVVGLTSGPVGAAMAACLATGARLWIGGAGAALGFAGIWLACGVSIIGFYFAKRGYNSTPDVVVFSALNAGVALLILFLLPSSVRGALAAENAHAALLLLNFGATLIATFFVRIDMLRRKNAQLNELHKQIVSALPDALNVKDLKGRFLLANAATAKLMGASDAASMIGKSDFDYYSARDASQFWQREQAFLRNPKPVVLEQQFERDGNITWLNTVKAPYFDEVGALKGIVSHTADISTQKALQAELISTQVLLETAMTEMADGLAMFDREGQLIVWNRRYLEFFPYVDEMTCKGCTLPELLTAGVLRGDIKIPEDSSPLTWVQEEVERSQAAAHSELMLSDGRWVSKTTRALADGGWVTLYADISDKRAAARQLESLASRDGLTDLLNRRSFDRQLEGAFQTATKTDHELSLLMIDVDYFKAYNDTYGHPAGDEVLRQVAAVLQSCCRIPIDIVARYGGEEFAVILPGTSEDAAHAIALRLLAAVRMLEIPHIASPKGRVTMSVGLTCIDHEMANCQQLLRRCDEALYAAKAAGRDKVRTFQVSPAINLGTGAVPSTTTIRAAT
jgi:diguanylate cyclase (GGDEF)-like protein/PAS domain S-box-containing protein